jgi:putative glycosyltransferase
VKLSIVATLYKSEDSVAEFHRRAAACAQALAGDDYEIVLVNDGSPDASLERAIELTRGDARLVVVDLSRNFGHHKAMMTGLANSRGERVFLVDSDLEEEPEWLGAFARRMDHERCDVVYGVQQSRKGNAFERLSGRWFYRFFRAVTGLALPENLVTARLMSRRYVDALLRHDEREVFMAGLWAITGFDQRPEAVVKHSTHPSTYTLRRKLSLLVNSITSFSNAPLTGIFYVGVGISLIALGYTAFLVFHWLFLARPPSGWTSVMASIWLLGGLIISFIGIVGIYLSKIYSETKRRPYTIVREIHRGGDRAPREPRP